MDDHESGPRAAVMRDNEEMLDARRRKVLAREQGRVDDVALEERRQAARSSTEASKADEKAESVAKPKKAAASKD